MQVEERTNGDNDDIETCCKMNIFHALLREEKVPEDIHKYSLYARSRNS